MYSRPLQVDHGLSTGFVIAYWVKLGLASYAIAYYQFGFRLPSLPFDIAYILHAL